MTRALLFLLLTAFTCCASALELRDEARSLALSAARLATMPRHSVEVRDHGTPARFEGVALADVLALLGIEPGARLRGADLDRYLLVGAADSYRVVFALAELDAGTGRRFVLLADRRDGAPLSAHEGPYRLIVPDDVRAARWVRQVTRLRLLRAPSIPGDLP